MRELFRRIRTNWSRTDTVVFVSNTGAFLFLVANCWWKSVALCYAVLFAALLVQASRASRAPDALRRAFVLGGIIALLWPVGEGLVVRVVGWWGAYNAAPGPRIWDTPVYCVLVGWVSFTYCVYLAERTQEAGYGVAWACAVSGATALVLGVLGENLFAEAGMWRYTPSDLDLWSVPAFVPVSYGLASATFPLLRRAAVVPAALAFCIVLLVLSVGLGLVVGFFPTT